MNKTKSIRLSDDVYTRLLSMAHTDQSLNGVIAEILDKYYPLPKTPEPPKPPEKGYEAPPNPNTIVSSPNTPLVQIQSENNNAHS